VSRYNNGASDIGFSSSKKRDALKAATISIIDERLNPREKSMVSVKSSFIFKRDSMSSPGKYARYNMQTISLTTGTGLRISNTTIN
jgi:hypothetical protein